MLKSVFCLIINTNRLRHFTLLSVGWAGLALCSGGEESNQSTGEADAEDVVHVGRGSLRSEVRMRYRDSGTDTD